MLLGAHFTPENNPDLALKPLKGDMLREFVEMIRDRSKAKKMGISDDSPFMQDPDMREVTAITRKIVHAITYVLNQPGAERFGIDMNDLQVIIRRATKSDATELSIASAIEHKSSDAQVALNQHEALIAQVISQQFAELFSMCLAVDEHKEADLLAIHNGILTQSMTGISKLRNLSESDLEEAQTHFWSLVSAVVIADQFLAVLKARKSPVVPLMEQMVYGEKYPQTQKKEGMHKLLEHTIGVFENIDGSTKGGQEKIRAAKKGVFTQVFEYLGIKSREID